MTPRLYGILNVTEDSFSDGGRYLAIDDACAHADSLIEGGADVIDIGAASSNPDANPIEPDVEIERLSPVIEFVQKRGVAVSIDSWKPEVQKFALDRGVDVLNDIQGFPDKDLYPTLARASAQLVVMHSVQSDGPATRVELTTDTVWEHLVGFFDRRFTELTAAGISKDRLILDPGMGFFLSTLPEVSVAVLQRIGDLKDLFGVPVLISVSRKSFLRKLSGRPVGEVGSATLAAEIFAAGEGADAIRTHDVQALTDGLRVINALSGND